MRATGLLGRILDNWLALLTDAACVLVSLSAATAIRFSTLGVTQYLAPLWPAVVLLVGVRLGFLQALGLHNAPATVFRRRQVVSLMAAVALSSLIAALLILGLTAPFGRTGWFPFSLLLLELPLGVICAAAVRLASGIWDTKIASQLQHRVQSIQRPIGSNRKPLLVAVALGLLVCGRLFLQLMLYRSGFESLTADEFDRVIRAGLWAQGLQMDWRSAWLPFHKYMLGAALGIRWDLLCVPRAITIPLGAISILLMYKLARSLFESYRIGLVSAILLAVNPAHAWLSSTPLTEIVHTTAAVASMMSFVLYVRRRAQRYLFASAFILAIGNGFRFESWMMSIVFSFWLFGEAVLHIRHKTRDIGGALNLMVAALIPWVFPMVWVTQNYMTTGDPLHFFTAIKSYKLTYGESRSYFRYLGTFLRIDPYATVLCGVGLVMCLVRYRKSRAVQWFVAMAAIPFCVFAYLQGGQMEPPGNYVRYLAPFMFVAYPATAALIDFAISIASKSQWTRMLLSVVVIGGMVITQARATFGFVNDPAARGLKVGQRIRAVRTGDPDLADRPFLIGLLGISWRFTLGRTIYQCCYTTAPYP